MDDGPTFADLLKRSRLALGLTHEALAERAGLSYRTISDLERGVSRHPRAETLALLGDALGLSGEQRALFERVARPAPIAPARPAPRDWTSGGLPQPMTRLLGRDQAVRQLRELLRRSGMRMVTLTGPGGVGKTRLAIEVGLDLRDGFGDDVVFVPLAGVDNCHAAVHAMLRAVDPAQADSHDPWSTLLEVLRDRRQILLLDNAEHLLDLAPRLAELLQHTKGVQLLVTSRAPLRVSGEQAYPLAPLSLPDLGRLPSVEELAALPSVALFVERAERAKPDFALTAEIASAVAGICVCLDGLPLALELAAVWVKMFSPAALLAQLSSPLTSAPLQLLTVGARDWPVRHRTLRDTIAWSYDLLTPDEQRLLRQLSVFSGSCSLEAIAAVCHPAPSEPLLQVLSWLVEQSLLKSSPGPDGSPRFAMLRTIRAFALEQLSAMGEEAMLSRQHAEYYLELVKTARGLLFTSTQRRLRFAAEKDNIEAALHWLVIHGWA